MLLWKTIDLNFNRSIYNDKHELAGISFLKIPRVTVSHARIRAVIALVHVFLCVKVYSIRFQ